MANRLERSSWTLMAAAALGVMLGQPSWAGEPDIVATPPRVAVWVRNDGEVRVEVLSLAKAIVADIYRRAAVNIVWQLPSTPLEIRSSQASRFGIEIVSPKRARRLPFASTCDVWGAATGSASERGRVAYVRYECIERLVEQGGLERSYALGVVMAHELGHLLLPYHAHSTSGVMKADWNPADLYLAARGRLLFAPEQVPLIQSRLVGTPATR